MIRSGTSKLVLPLLLTVSLSAMALVGCGGDDDNNLDDDGTSSGGSSGRTSSGNVSSSGGSSGRTSSSGGSSGTTSSSGGTSSSSGGSTSSSGGSTSSSGGSSGELPNTDIRDIQNGTVETGTVVRADGVVTAVDPASKFFFMQEQEGAAPYSGIAVYLGGEDSEYEKPAVGDVVVVEGPITEFQRPNATVTRTNFDNPTHFEVTGIAALPAPAVIADPASLMAEATAEQYEGVLVSVGNVTVTGAPNNFSDFTVTGGLVVANRLFAYAEPAVNDVFTTLAGVLDHDRNTYRVFPRSVTDMVRAPAPINLVSLTPANESSVVGTTRNYTITLSRAPEADTVINVTSSNPAVAAPVAATATVAAGSTTTTFEVNALTVDPAPVVLTAELAGSNPATVTANLTVVAVPTAPYSISNITVYGNIGGAVAAGERTGIATVQLVAPAPAGGFMILLEDETGVIAVPAEVTVPEGATSVTFRVRADAQVAGPVQVFATDAENDIEFTVNVVDVAPAPTVAGKELVINEIVYEADADTNCDGAVSATNDELVEIVNISNHPVQLNGLKLWDATATARHVFTARVIGPGEAFMVIPRQAGATAERAAPAWCAGATATSIGDVLVIKTSDNNGLGLNNGADTVELTLTNRADVIDRHQFNGDPAPKESLERNPQIGSVTAFIKHSALPGAIAGKYSPGTLANGAAFAVFNPPAP